MIKIRLVGTGWMAKLIARDLSKAGIKISSILSSDFERADEFAIELRTIGVDCWGTDDPNDPISRNVDATIVATSNPWLGLFAARSCAKHGLLLSFSAEMDSAFGPQISDLLHDRYKLVGGDQHVQLLKLIKQFKNWGTYPLGVISCKGFLNEKATCFDVYDEAHRINCGSQKQTIVQMMDGTKMWQELVTVANGASFEQCLPALIANNWHEVVHHFKVDDDRYNKGFILYTLPVPGKINELRGSVGLVVEVPKVMVGEFEHMKIGYRIGQGTKGDRYLIDHPYHPCHFPVVQDVIDAVEGRGLVYNPTREFFVGAVEKGHTVYQDRVDLFHGKAFKAENYSGPLYHEKLVKD